MHRVIISGLVFALMACFATADEKKEEPKKEEKKPGQIFQDLVAETRKAVNAEKTTEAKVKVLKTFAPRFLAFAEKNPKEREALNSLMIIVGNIPAGEEKASPRARALDLLRKTQLDSPNLGDAMDQLADVEGEDMIAFFKDVLDKSKSKKVRARALEAIMGNREKSLLEADEKKAAEVRAELDVYRKQIASEFKDEIKDLFIGARMPELTSKSLDGKDVKLSALKGKVVVLDLWATWCPPCRAMIPHSRKLVERMKDKPFVLVGVSFDDEADTVKEFMKSNAMPWTHWFNGKDGEIGKKLDVKFFPTIYVLDTKGVIRYRNIREEALDKAVETLVKEVASEKKDK